MCSIFAVSKREKIDVKFADILEGYRELNEHSKDIHEEIYQKISVNGEVMSIKIYYNEHFIKNVKDIILSLKAK